jgi:16S rRNA (adenine1518-N6/adenine1519-N6)-dimethyltransferase
MDSIRRTIKSFFKKYFLRPEKRLGQHFLIDKKILKKIVETANLKPKDVVLEIGPGIGNLTQELAKVAKRVVAIEKDPKMIEILKETLKGFDNAQIIKDDILKINLKSSALNLKSYKVVANLPYYIVSPVIRKFLESESPPREMVLMVQKEVGQRICAKPPAMNLLAVSVQFYAKPEIISYVSKKSFWPEPKVDSAIIKISKIKNRARRSLSDHQKSKIDKDLFFKIVRAGFSQPRKQIFNNLSKELNLEKEVVKNWLLKNKIQPTQRAETLSLKDWLSLTKSFDLLKNQQHTHFRARFGTLLTQGKQ